MAQVLNRLLFNGRIYLLLKNNKRFAGHSKWQNIRHTKEENDHNRMLLFHRLKLQMMIAIQEGGSEKPSHNLKLSQVIEQAKKANMPAASIKAFLERMEARKNKTLSGVIEVRGPNGYVMLVCYTTDNPKLFAHELNSKLKKTKYEQYKTELLAPFSLFSSPIRRKRKNMDTRKVQLKITSLLSSETNFILLYDNICVQHTVLLGKATDTSAKNMFVHTGNVIVEKKGNLEQAIEDTINVGAEDVEEFEENNAEYFQFKCDPKLLNKIRHLLEDRQYCILSAEEEYIPKTVIKLSESDLEAVSCIREKVLSLDDVSQIHDNLA